MEDVKGKQEPLPGSKERPESGGEDQPTLQEGPVEMEQAEESQLEDASDAGGDVALAMNRVEMVMKNMPPPWETAARRAHIMAMSHEDICALVSKMDSWAEHMATQWERASVVIWQLLVTVLKGTNGLLPKRTSDSQVRCSPQPGVPFVEKEGGPASRVTTATDADLKAINESFKKAGVGPAGPGGPGPRLRR